MKVKLCGLADTKKLAKKLAKKARAGDIILLHGDLGAGKTTFTKYFVDALKIKIDVVSPTFTIVNDYGKVKHLDLYRIEDKRELDNIGIEEILYSNNICLIEWPEKVGDDYFDGAYNFYLTKLGENEREMEIDEKFVNR